MRPPTALISGLLAPPPAFLDFVQAALRLPSDRLTAADAIGHAELDSGDVVESACDQDCVWGF